MSSRIERHVTSSTLLPALKTIDVLLDTSDRTMTLVESRLHNTSADVQTQIKRQQKVIISYLARLRTQARALAYMIRDTKATTAESRAEVDRLLLQLQNLYYEQRHLLAEIAACEEYDHPYARLPLIEEEEYLSYHPEHDELDEDELMPKRIEYEDQERRRMEAELEILRREKDALLRDIEQRRTRLRNWDEKTESWLTGGGEISKELEQGIEAD